ncbi:MAG: Asp-tRNA(Asn)/Glu-tRNA(Gln) amidotransferase subunit GatC [Kiritimatiellia bacterium]
MQPSQTIDVGYVANLARLALTDEEISTFQRQLGAVLAHVDKLGELDLEGIAPTTYGQPACGTLREDTPRKGLETETVLSNAPARRGDEFQVPKIVE